jgi:hypothetical protein
MKQKTRKKVVRAIESRLTRILRDSASDDDLSDIKNKRDREVWRSGSFQILLSSELRAELEGALKKRPDPTREQLDKFLEEVKTLDPLSLLRPSLTHLARRLPPFPPGKPPKLSSAQQKEALAEVIRLSSRGVLSRKAVYRNVAKKYRVHWRTIQNLSTKSRSSKRNVK